MLKSLFAIAGAALLLAACDTAPQAVTAPPPPPAPAAAPSYMVFFDWDRSDLSNQALATIGQAANAWKAGGSPHITAIGHTDTSGPADYNMALSLRRASAVKNALIQQGVAPGAIDTVGKGETELLVQTGDGVREPQNRRVEITGFMASRGVDMSVFRDPRAYCKALSDKYRQYRVGTQRFDRSACRHRPVRRRQLQRGDPDAREYPDRPQDPAAGAGLSLAGPPLHAGLRQPTRRKRRSSRTAFFISNAAVHALPSRSPR